MNGRIDTGAFEVQPTPTPNPFSTATATATTTTTTTATFTPNYPDAHAEQCSLQQQQLPFTPIATATSTPTTAGRRRDCNRQPRQRTLLPHHDVASQRQGAGGRRTRYRRHALISAQLYDRPPAAGLRRAASPPHALLTQQRCCPTASAGGRRTGVAAASLQAQNGTTRPMGHGVPPATSPPHALITRRDVASKRQGVCGSGYNGTSTSAELHDPAQWELDCHGQPQHDTHHSHSNVAA